jgi:heme exporter protein B
MSAEAGAKASPKALTSFFKSMWAVVWKDLRAESRGLQLISAMLIFSLLVILIFNFALELDARERANVTSGVLWVTFVYAGTLGLNRSMAVEKDRGCLDGLLLAPVDRSSIYFGKVIGNLLFMFIVEGIVLVFYAIFYNNFGVFQPGLLLVIVLGSIGYSVVGTLLSSMSVQARTRDVLLPILLFPVALPVLISAVRASGYFLEGLGMEYIWPPINVLIAFDLIYIGVSYIFFDYVVEE